MLIIKNFNGSRTIFPENQEEIDAFDHIDETLGAAGFHFHINKFVQQRIEQKRYDESNKLNDDLSLMSPEAVARVKAAIKTEMDKITTISQDTPK